MRALFTILLVGAIGVLSQACTYRIDGVEYTRNEVSYLRVYLRHANIISVGNRKFRPDTGHYKVVLPPGPTIVTFTLQDKRIIYAPCPKKHKCYTYYTAKEPLSISFDVQSGHEYLLKAKAVVEGNTTTISRGTRIPWKGYWYAELEDVTDSKNTILIAKVDSRK